MTEDKIWHMPFSAERLLSGKLECDAVNYVSGVENPRLAKVILEECQTRHAKHVNSKNGFYYVFGAVRHSVNVKNEFKLRYMPSKPIWVTGLNAEQVQTVKDIVSELEASQLDADDPILFEGEAFSVNYVDHNHQLLKTRMIALWVIRQSCKKRFSQPKKRKKPLEEMVFSS